MNDAPARRDGSPPVAAPIEPPDPPGGRASRGGLRSRSFLGLLATQFLGAFNDNQFRWLVILIGSGRIGAVQATSLGTACFTLPYLLFATHAAWLADRFDKRQVIVGCKLAEIVLMALAVAGILLGNVYALLAVVFLMGTQSALFGPAKFGSIPEMLRAEKISSGNGVMALVTVVASALGMFVAFLLYRPVLSEGPAPADLSTAGGSLLGIALAGWLASLTIGRLVPADLARRYPWNPVPETWRNLRFLGRHTPLLRATLGIAFFWFLASLAQQNINVFGERDLGLAETGKGTLLVVLVAGLGLGSVLAGLWSGGKVELGIVPLGAFGIVISGWLLYVAGESVDPNVARSAQVAFWWSAVWLFLLGASAGLFNIPLEAFLQHRSETETRGTILAAANFVAFALMLGSAGLFYLMQEPLGWSASEIFLAIAIGTVPVLVYIVRLLPDATIRFLAWLGSHTVYRVKVRGREHLPERGGALLVANHVSWLDGILLLLVSSRPIRVLAETADFRNPVLKWLARLYGVIPIHSTDGPKALLKSLQTAREAILNGELVCIFAEGRLTRTGQLQPFHRGLMRIVEGTGAPVVPVYLDQLWGSIFSYRGGRILRKRPRQWPYPVTISFGPPLPEPDDVNQVRQAVQNLGVESAESRKQHERSPARRFLRQCRRASRACKVADSTGMTLSGRGLLARTLATARALRRILGRDEARVGVLLPPSLDGVVAHAALALLRRTTVNLNETFSDEENNAAIRLAELRHVITSRSFAVSRAESPVAQAASLPSQPAANDTASLDAERIFLEDLAARAGWWDRLAAWCGAWVLPVFVLERLLGLRRVGADDPLTVLFTSGSIGEPKGVMLSQHNITSNIDAADAMYDARTSDVILGVLPFSHAFGYTLTMWLPLVTSARGVYQHDPTDAAATGRLCAAHRATILLATPERLRTYVDELDPAAFQSLELAVVGATKLAPELAAGFQERFGLAPTEGYGATELAPLVSANIPRHRAGGRLEKANKPGTVGRAIPGVSVKAVDPASGKDLGTNREGELLVRGPNLMLGYLGRPEMTAEAVRDGWYRTGDLGRIDDEGFIEITGRLEHADEKLVCTEPVAPRLTPADHGDVGPPSAHPEQRVP